MTIHEFLRELKSLNTKWYITVSASCIRSTNSQDKHFCPVTAVAQKHTNKYYTPLFANIAAMEIGLPAEIMNKITKAADNEPGHNKWYRAQLLKACSLREMETPTNGDNQ